MERFGFEIYVTDPHTGKTGRVTAFEDRSLEVIREKEKKEYEKLVRKALKEHKSIKQVKALSFDIFKNFCYTIINKN